MKSIGLLFLFAIFIVSGCRYEPVKVSLKAEEIPEPEPEPEPLPEPEPAKLTLMVYMAADNDLESHALANLKEMERAEYKEMNVLVLLDRAEGYDETEGDWKDTRLYEVVHDKSGGSAIKSKRLSCPELGLSASSKTELDMANPQVLKRFIEFGRGSYQADYYALVIWGHGSGWKAFAIDDRTDSYMTVKELARAVRNQGLGVIGFDTCFGGVIENIYELKDCAEYTVASPGVTPGSGWNYKALLEALCKGDWTAENTARLMSENSAGTSGAATVFVNEKLPELFEAFEAFSKALSGTVKDSQSQASLLSTLLNCKSYCYSVNPCDLYLDITSMAEKWCGGGSSTELSESAAELSLKAGEVVLEIKGSKGGIGVHLIPKSRSGALESLHSTDYIKDISRADQSAFITESQWWVPTKGGASDSLLDKLFYRVY